MKERHWEENSEARAFTNLADAQRDLQDSGNECQGIKVLDPRLILGVQDLPCKAHHCQYCLYINQLLRCQQCSALMRRSAKMCKSDVCQAARLEDDTSRAGVRPTRAVRLLRSSSDVRKSMKRVSRDYVERSTPPLSQQRVHCLAPVILTSPPNLYYAR